MDLSKLRPRIQWICGACHRTSADAVLPGLSKMGIINVRLQPYRLEKSRCWGKGNARLTCVGCHDPHVQVARNLDFMTRSACNAMCAQQTPSQSRCTGLLPARWAQKIVSIAICQELKCRARTRCLPITGSESAHAEPHIPINRPCFSLGVLVPIRDSLRIDPQCPAKTCPEAKLKQLAEFPHRPPL